MSCDDNNWAVHEEKYCRHPQLVLSNHRAESFCFPYSTLVFVTSHRGCHTSSVAGGGRGGPRLARCVLPAHSSGWKIHFGAKLTRWAVNAKSGHVADLTFVQSTQSSRSFDFKRKRVACVPIRFRQTRDTGSWSRRPTLFGHVAVGRPRA